MRTLTIFLVVILMFTLNVPVFAGGLDSLSDSLSNTKIGDSNSSSTGSTGSGDLGGLENIFSGDQGQELVQGIQGIFSQIGDLFKNLFSQIKDIFSGIFNNNDNSGGDTGVSQPPIDSDTTDTGSTDDGTTDTGTTDTGTTDTDVSTPNDGVDTTPGASEDKSWATSFKRDYIMSDEEFTDYNSMTTADIQSFLDRKGSVLKNNVGSVNPAAAIYAAAQKHKINPKVLVARLQTEQGLISKKTATQKKLDWALGVGCYDSGNWNQNFKGFDKQIDGAASTFRRHFDSGNKTKKVDGTTVNCKSSATYSLYMYTPHFGGNELNWKVYKGYFGK